MLPKRFAKAAEQARDSLLNGNARQLVDGRTRDGRQVSVFRGLAPGQTVRDSIGCFVIVTAEDSEPHPRSGVKRRNDTSTATVEVIPAGSVDVHHPSLGEFPGSKLQVAAGVGRLTIPGEIDPDNLAMLGSEPIYPTGMPIPPEQTAQLQWQRAPL
jgi:hypothetical protein